MFKKISFKAKLIFLTIFTSAMMIAIGAISSYGGGRVEREYRFIVEKTVPKTELVNDMATEYWHLRSAVQTLGFAGVSRAGTEAALATAKQSIQKFEEIEGKYVGLGFVDGQKERYEQAHAAWLAFKSVSEEMLSLQQKNAPEAQSRLAGLLSVEFPAKAKAFRESADSLLAFHGDILHAKTKAAADYSSSAAYFTWILIVLATAVGLGISLFVAFVSSGELKSIVDSLIDNVSEVSGTVSDLTSSAAALSSAAETQSSSIQETAASMEEIRTMVQKNSENTEESAGLSGQSKEYAGAGQASVQEMIAAMAEITASNGLIQNEVESSNRRISEIVKIIGEIEAKTNVINDIVFQTKLLSFNASVEAARAGEHGKGFAVVAEEVGNLANMSGTAAKEITGMLAESTRKVNQIVSDSQARVRGLIDEAAAKLERGNKVAGSCGEVLDKIVTNSEQLARRVASIAEASREQASGVNEIGKAIQLIDQSTHVNATETANTAASAEHLGGQVKSLNHSIYRLQSMINGRENAAGTIVNAFIWRERYALGVTVMDNEHKVLIEKINALVTGINGGLDLRTLKGLFVDLADYTKEHFADEERYMASIQYPQLADHQKIHRSLLAKVAQFGEKFDSGSLDAVALVAFLNDWLIKHILGVDMRYANFSRTGKSAELIRDAAA